MKKPVPAIPAAEAQLQSRKPYGYPFLTILPAKAAASIETENCQTEGPFDLAFRPSDIFGDSSFQQGQRATVPMRSLDQQCRDSGSHRYDIVHFEAP